MVETKTRSGGLPAWPSVEMSSPEELFVWCYVHADGTWAITLQGDGRNPPGAEAGWRLLKVALPNGADTEALEGSAGLRGSGLLFRDERRLHHGPAEWRMTPGA